MGRIVDSRATFTNGAVPVLATAAGSTPDGRGAMVFLVIDDSEHDDIVEAIAAADTPFAHGFSGEWGYFNDRTGVVMRFTLRSEAGGPDRRWLVADPTPEMLSLLQHDHMVVLMPAEIAGDLTHFDFSTMGARMRGALLINVTYGDAGNS